MGHLQFSEIMEHSKKQLADVLYPVCGRLSSSKGISTDEDLLTALLSVGTPVQPYDDFPDTEYPTEREARIAKRYNDMVAEMKYTPFFIEAPTRASTGTCPAVKSRRIGELALLTAATRSPSHRHRTVVRPLQTKNGERCDGDSCIADAPLCTAVR